MRNSPAQFVRNIFCSVLVALIGSGCGGARDETIGGVTIPIPAGMKRIEGQRIELALPGLSGENASFEGNVEPEKLIEFYKTEMPARGWQPAMGLISRGGILAFSKEGKSVLLAIGKSNSVTNLSVTVGASSP